ncbi:potassium transporter, partial [Planoprotostelium fungivorum]
YMIMIITANNHGEGGTFSLCALLSQQENVSVKRVVRAVAIIGGSLIIGQGAISPAVKISKAISIVGAHATYYDTELGHLTLFNNHDSTETRKKRHLINNSPLYNDLYHRHHRTTGLPHTWSHHGALISLGLNL